MCCADAPAGPRVLIAAAGSATVTQPIKPGGDYAEHRLGERALGSEQKKRDSHSRSAGCGYTSPDLTNKAPPARSTARRGGSSDVVS